MHQDFIHLHKTNMQIKKLYGLVRGDLVDKLVRKFDIN